MKRLIVNYKDDINPMLFMDNIKDIVGKHVKHYGEQERITVTFYLRDKPASGNSMVVVCYTTDESSKNPCIVLEYEVCFEAWNTRMERENNEAD